MTSRFSEIIMLFIQTYLNFTFSCFINLIFKTVVTKLHNFPFCVTSVWKMGGKNQINQYMGKWIEQTTHKRRNGNGHYMHEKCSPSLSIREVQIKMSLKFHLPTEQNDYHQRERRNAAGIRRRGVWVAFIHARGTGN